MAKKNTKKYVKASGVLFLSIKTKRFLFMMRSDDSYTNTWATVGGRSEQGESIVESLTREIQEEIGFLPIVRKTIPIDLYVSPDRMFEFHTFICLVDNEFIPILNDEHSGYAWSSINNYPKPLHPALFSSLKNQELLTKIENVIKLLEVGSSDELSEVNGFIIR
jgi:8-oxo-dGTP pyrophosphatase MutT (NUDIX family)